ncbi:MAG: 8-oxo-dGTP diphosphatase [Candidatus Obscuribacterales bacterium]|nr:8-oxo-dGTP diphosphatase [Candidatus Obscuribacterales bacterium]
MSAYCPILATLVYVMSPDKTKVLLIHRNKRPNDLHFGKYNGLGGKIENNENIVEAMKREVLEEAGIECRDIVLRGTISWPGFGKDGENWFGFIFRVDSFSGVPHEGNHEGSLEWVPLSDIDKLDLWESDRLWLDKVFSDELTTFHGLAPFKDGKLVSWHYSNL